MCRWLRWFQDETVCDSRACQLTDRKTVGQTDWLTDRQAGTKLISNKQRATLDCVNFTLNLFYFRQPQDFIDKLWHWWVNDDGESLTHTSSHLHTRIYRQTKCQTFARWDELLVNFDAGCVGGASVFCFMAKVNNDFVIYHGHKHRHRHRHRILPKIKSTRAKFFENFCFVINWA